MRLNIMMQVLATDIFDPELNSLRKNRWVKAFSEQGNPTETKDARATVVIEHIIQVRYESKEVNGRKWPKRHDKPLFLTTLPYSCTIQRCLPYDAALAHLS